MNNKDIALELYDLLDDVNEATSLNQCLNATHTLAKFFAENKNSIRDILTNLK